MKKVHLKIYGLVQGVNFRYYTKDLAEKLNLSGFIRNNLDGTVEIEAEGEEKSLKKIITFAKTGPQLAKVDNIEIHFKEPVGEKGFKVL